MNILLLDTPIALTAPHPPHAPGASSKFPIVNAIATAIGTHAKRDHAPNEIEAKLIVASLGEENGFHDVWSEEERAMFLALQTLSCGPRTANYGWRLYANYLSTGDLHIDAVSY